MQIHQLQRKTPRSLPKRVGRGGLRGKTSGRGHKGQKAHGGHGIRPAVRDIIKKLPKLRGYKFNVIRLKPVGVNVSVLQNICKAGDMVTPQLLFDKGILSTKKDLKRGAKILGNGELSLKLTIVGCSVSKTAEEKITKAGGEIVAS